MGGFNKTREKVRRNTERNVRMRGCDKTRQKARGNSKGKARKGG